MVLSTGFQLRLELAQILVEYGRDGRRRVAVHVDESVERPFWAGEQPVDRALFVPLHMVLVERLHEVVAQILYAERLGDESQILLEVLLTKRHPQELPEPRHDVVLEPVAIDNWYHVVRVRLERRLRDLRR